MKEYKKLVQFLKYPFMRNGLLFFFILLFLSIIDLLYYWTKGFRLYSIYFFLNSFFITWIAILISVLFRNKFLRNAYLYIIVGVSFLWFLLDIFCFATYHMRFNESFAGMVLGTNLSESIEFLESYVNTKILLLIIVGAAFISIGAFIYKWLLKNSFFLYLNLLMVFFSCFLCIWNRGVWKDSVVGKTMFFFTIEIAPDLINDPPLLKINENKEIPQNVIVIIGESFSKSHSSLYGYKMDTNPKLKEFVKQKRLFVYNNVTSPACWTVEAFRCIMSTYRPEFNDSIQWYSLPTIPLVMKSVGYKTYWLSNQSKTGLLDNFISKYADLCDTSFFIGNKFSAGFRSNYDGELLKPLRNEINKSLACKNCFFIHLIGSHESFNKRFPPDFQLFSAENYAGYSEEAKGIIADYDNSILYNDYVVSEMMDTFKEYEAIVFYFPDHGLDIFESSSDYAGHAKRNDPRSLQISSEIPFVIWMSDKFQNKFPEIVKIVNDNKNVKFRTDDFIYSIMNLIGVEFVDNTFKDNSFMVIK